MVSYFGSYIAVDSFKILQVILCIQLVHNFNLRCPVQSEWDVVARRRCNSTDNYVCLFDENSFIYGTTCSPRSHFEPSGYKSILLGGITRKECSSLHYQPFIFWTNGSSECVYHKSLCTEEGQVVYQNGTTKTDRTCHCDYTRNYAFTREPRNKCFCVPSEEDCSCNIKDCPIGHLLTPDYECVSVTNWKPFFSCKEIDDHSVDIPRPVFKENATTEASANISEVGLSNKVVIIVFILLCLLYLAGLLMAPALLSLLIVQTFFQIFVQFLSPAESDTAAAEKTQPNDEESAIITQNNRRNANLVVINSTHYDEQDKGRKIEKTNIDNFVETDDARRLVDELQKKQCIIILGPPGSGKSSYMYYASLKLKKDHGFSVISGSIPSDVINNHVKGSKQLFLFDDALGKYSLDEDKVDKWRQEERDLNTIVNENTEIRLILTCRSYIFYRSPLQNMALSPMLHHLELSLEDRKEICQKYLEPANLQKLTDDVINMYNFFPLICFTFAQEKMRNTVNFFTYPHALLKKEIDRLKERADVAYFALALLVVLNNSIEIKMLDINNHALDRIIYDLFNESDLPNLPSKSLIKKNMEALVGTYLTETNNTFRYLHYRLFEMVSFCMGNNFISTILNHGNIHFIKDRLRLATFTKQPKGLKILVPPKLETEFFNRLLADLKKGHNKAVFSNRQMQSKAYRIELRKSLERNLSPQDLKVESDGTTALHVLAKYGDEDLVHFFIKMDKELVHRTTETLKSPLHFACEKGTNDGDKNDNVAIVKLLLKYDADINLQDSEGWTPLHIACLNKNLDIVNCLVERQNIKFKTDVKGRTSLYIACEANAEEIVKQLLKYKPPRSIKYKKGKGKALHVACQNGFTRVADCLLQYGAKVNTRDENGLTPLHVACEFSKLNIAKILLEHKAEVNTKSKQMETALSIARRKHHADMVELLLQHRAK